MENTNITDTLIQEYDKSTKWSDLYNLKYDKLMVQL